MVDTHDLIEIRGKVSIWDILLTDLSNFISDVVRQVWVGVYSGKFTDVHRFYLNFPRINSFFCCFLKIYRDEFTYILKKSDNFHTIGGTLLHPSWWRHWLLHLFYRGKICLTTFISQIVRYLYQAIFYYFRKIGKFPPYCHLTCVSQWNGSATATWGQNLI